MTLLRIAAGLVRTSTPGNRWRRIVVPWCTFLFMVLLLASTSVALMAERQNDRNTARLPAISSSPSATDLFMKVDSDFWREKSIVIAWIEPAVPQGMPVLAPGMATFPAPGQAIVSPALDRLARGNPGLAQRFPQRLVLDYEGVQSEGELFGYIRPLSGRMIGGEDLAVQQRNGQWMGRGPVMRVSGFGGTTQGLYLADQIPVLSVMMGLFGMAVIPGLVVLAIGLASASPIRDNRFQVLLALGAPKRTLRLIGGLETWLLAVPAIAAAAALWGLVVPHLRTVPLVGQQLVPGDLSIPWELLLVEAAVTMAICWLTSIAVTRTGLRGAPPRPTSAQQQLSIVATAPLLLSVAAFALARVVGGGLAADLNLLGLISAVGGMPLVMPGILRSVGRRIRRSDSVTASLAGNAMQWDPVRVARPFMGLAALLVLALVGTGYVALASYVEFVNRTETASSAVYVEWQQTQPADLERLADALDDTLVVPFGRTEDAHVEGHGADHGDHAAARGRELILGATCAELSVYVAEPSCDSQAGLRLSDSSGERAAALFSGALNYPVEAVRLVPSEQLAESGRAVVLGTSALPVLDERVRNAAMSTLPAPSVESAVESRPVVSSLVGWISAGTAVALTTLVIGSLVSLVDRLLASRRRHNHLLNLGILPHQLTLFGAAMFAIPYSVVALVALAAGLTIFMAMMSSGVPVPWGAVRLIVIGTLAVGVAGTLFMATFGSKQALREHE